MTPGEVFPEPGHLDLNPGRATATLVVEGQRIGCTAFSASASRLKK